MHLDISFAVIRSTTIFKNPTKEEKCQSVSRENGKWYKFTGSGFVSSISIKVTKHFGCLEWLGQCKILKLGWSALTPRTIQTSKTTDSFEMEIPCEKWTFLYGWKFLNCNHILTFRILKLESIMINCIDSCLWKKSLTEWIQKWYPICWIGCERCLYKKVCSSIFETFAWKRI